MRQAEAGTDLWRMLSRTGEYAIRSALHIARRSEPTSAAEIAATLGVPAKYLARVLNTLVQAGTLSSSRGARGGFRLNRPAAKLSLAEIVAPFDAVASPAQCLLRQQRCGTGEPCVAHGAWHQVAAGVRAFFRDTTLADLLASVDSADELNVRAARRSGRR